MKKLFSALILAIILLLSLVMMVSLPTAAQEPDSPPKGTDPLPTPTPAPAPIDPGLLPKIEPQLLKKLLTEPEPVEFIVYMTTTADLDAAIASVPALGTQGDPAAAAIAKRAAIVHALQQTAQNSQGGVLEQLNNPSGGLSGQAATNIQPLWIVNAVAARGTLPMVLDLATRPDVAIVRLNKTVQLNRPAPAIPSSIFKPQASPEWGIAKIRADLVQNALNIDGSGVVVANIDSGVDWFHPALQSKYRGYTGPDKLPVHAGNWHDATGDDAVYPTDSYGHGTHTMGTIVGDNGIGVAPGAKWIAVRAFNSSGSALNSWLHEAFQWILAPNDDSALAPDIVNNSWGSNNGSSTEFQPDVQALRAAGIYPIFSAGNNGPGSGTVGSPGSFDISFAVGATTIDDEIAYFSSRGPSPWGSIKPDVAAPGKDVVSTLPGGTYGSNNGTSMAAPHASGLAALLLQASPTLSNDLDGISTVMKTTAVPLGTPIPNNDFGWGRIDAYNAVMSVASVGALQGTVSGSGTPLADAQVRITPHGGGPAINTTTNAGGAYHQGLAVDTYDATASAFGYESSTISGIVIETNNTTTQDFNLTPKLTGTFSGTVTESGTGLPLAATIFIDNTPAETTTDPADGRFMMTLPTGTYTATVVAAAHRITQTVIDINDGATVEHHFVLDPAPPILLVDSGRWYQESEIGYYQQALDDLLYPYDTWTITDPFESPSDVPTTDDLIPYDIVIWSSPEDSPGYVGANDALESYLDQGRKLLLSGQDVAFYDSGQGFFIPSAPYLANYLKVDFVEDDANIDTISGIDGQPFAGLSFTINGGDGADNQFAPDVVTVAEADFAGPLLEYKPDQLAGVHTGLCVPYRTMFLPFGFESINTRADRRSVMEQALAWLMDTPAAYGVELTPDTALEIGNFGATVSHTVRLRNTGTTGNTYTLSISDGFPRNWPILPNTHPPVSLDYCESYTITLNVSVDTSNTWHVSDTFTVTAATTNGLLLTNSITRTTKTPAPVLLVDDDRWYSFAEEYQTALEANNIPYDYWYVPKSWSGPVPPSPPLDTLQMYPMVVWYTAYDWYQPLTSMEEDRLVAYLDGGGRLFFSSQDYIYNLPDHEPNDFAAAYLGVLDHTEDYSSTQISGYPGSLVGHGLGPYPLTFPLGYANWTDALTPTITARGATVGQAEQTNSVSLAGIGPNNEAWHTNFLAYGPELLTDTHRARLLQRSLGWLSWLGRSAVTSSVSSALDGTTVVYTATVINDGWIDLPTVHFTATFPAELTVADYASTLTPSGGNLIWQGSLDKNQTRIFIYTAAITDSLPLGTVVRQVSWLSYPEHNILFDRMADVDVNFPNLETSSLTVTPTQDAEENDVLTYTIVLKNTGPVDAPQVTTTNTLPHMLALMDVGTPGRGTVISHQESLTWTTPLSSNETVTLTYRAIISYRSQSNIRNTVYVDDNLNAPLELTAQTSFKSHLTYLPVIFKRH